MMIYAVQSYFERFARALVDVDPADSTLGRFERERLANGELCMSLRGAVDNRACLLIGSIAPPDNQLVEFLTLADALKRAGARPLVAFLPYLAYARQTRFAPGQSGGIATIGALMRAVGIDSLISVDAQSDLEQQLMGLPLISLMSYPQLFVPELSALGWADARVVAPHEGAVSRSRLLAHALGRSDLLARVVRRPGSFNQLQLQGKISRRIIIVDDLLDSGHGLVAAANLLHQRGAQDIAVVATHGLFTGSMWKELLSVGVRLILVSDSCPEALKTEEPFVRVVSIAPLLEELLAAIKKQTAHSLVN